MGDITMKTNDLDKEKANKERMRKYGEWVLKNHKDRLTMEEFKKLMTEDNPMEKHKK